MKKITMIMVGVLLLAGACFSRASDEPKAMADLHNAQGERAGIVLFEEAQDGVRIDIIITNLPAGEHAFHIHESPNCDRPDFKSAGGHFNPGGTKHGFLNPEGPHAGDLPNIVVKGDGTLIKKVVTDLITLDEGEKNSLFRGAGTSVVIHENPDDYITDPAGRGGKRIACGTIRKIE
ncbi:MAG: superoxide dismutase [Candidatus Omnitrophica bacterium]|nr:superoxide dismutase [Candidatus Omnitrophota bacterium]